VRYFKTAERVAWRARLLALLTRLSAVLIGWLAGLSLHARHAHASEPARVLLVAPSDASSLVSEALVRAQGELFAVGLASARTGAIPTDSSAAPSDGSTEPPRLPTDVYGLLVLEQREGAIIIHAWAPHSTSSLDARVELNAPGLTAEVLAVKAVETLRAAMVQFARRERGELPEAVRGFTKQQSPEAAPLEAPAAKPAAKPTAQPAPPPPPPDEAEPAEAPIPSDRGRLRSEALGAAAPLGAWLGPQLAVEPGGASVGGQIGLLVGPRWGCLALAFDTGFGRLQLDAAEGDAKVQRRALVLQAGLRTLVDRAWEAFVRGGVGYAAFDVRGQGAAGYRGLHLTHESLVLQANVGVIRWLTRSMGLYGHVGTVLALDAPSVLIAGRSVATLDHPSAFVSLGASAAVF